MRPLGAAGEDGRRIGFDRHNPDAGFVRFKRLARAGDCSAGTHTRDEDIHPAVGVAPDFLGRRPAVGFGIGGVFKLLRDEVARIRSRQFLGLADRAGHPFAARGEDQLGAVGAQEHAPFAAHRIRHGQQAFVSARGAHHRQCDPGVAAGRLDNDRIGLDPSGFFGGVDHRQTDPVLHRMRWIIEFKLGGHLRFRARRQAVDPHQRRVTDQIRYGICDFHTSPLFTSLPLTPSPSPSLPRFAGRALGEGSRCSSGGVRERGRLKQKPPHHDPGDGCLRFFTPIRFDAGKCLSERPPSLAKTDTHADDRTGDVFHRDNLAPL